MYTGSWAGDMAVGGAMNRASAAEQNTAEWIDAYNKLKAAFDRIELGNAANLGSRYALAAQLERHDSKNPLLIDRSLMERLQAAAESAFINGGKDFDAARDVGRTFKIPGCEGPVQAPVQLTNLSIDAFSEQDDGNNVDFLRKSYAGALAQREAFAAALKKIDPTHPLLTNRLLSESIRRAGMFAYKISGEQYNAARETGRSYSIPRR